VRRERFPGVYSPYHPILRGRICKRSVPRSARVAYFSETRGQRRGPAREHVRRERFPGVYIAYHPILRGRICKRSVPRSARVAYFSEPRRVQRV
jgi:hypothetical protein